MNKYLDKIAEQQEKPKHDWKPAIVGGVADVPAAAAVGALGMKLGKILPGKYGKELGIGLTSGVATAGAADYLQRRAEKQAVLEKKARETPMRKHTPGVGRHNDKKDSEFNEHELALGREVEHEHVDSYQAAEDIAKDHLSEIPDYYTRLKKMEKAASKVIRKMREHREDMEDISSEAASRYASHKSKKHKDKKKGSK